MITSKITKHLAEILKDMEVTDIAVNVESPTDLQFGDYTTNAALIAAKKLGKNPREVAEEIVKKLSAISHQLLVDKVDIAGPGFINFWVAKEELVKGLEDNSRLSGSRQIARTINTNIGKGRKVVIEYSSPNIAKPFTIGHLRSTIIGDAVANLLEAVGWDVYRDNHIGDWGTQFGKQIYAIKAWGNEEVIGNAERPVKELVDLYVKFHGEAEKDPSLEDAAREWFKKLEQGDKEARRLWEKCIEWSWKEFEAIYKELGVPSREGARFENNGRGYGEAFFEDKMADAIAELKEKELLKEGKEGAQMVFFPDETKLTPLMILKKDGASLYSTRDLATDKFRLGHYGKDVVVINEVGAEQSLYWNQIFETEQMLGWYKRGQRVHVKHGMYRFKEGKMSTRKGNVIWLEDVLYEAIERAMVLIQRRDDKADSSAKHVLSEKDKKLVAKQVGIGAIKWNDLKRDMKQDISFDWDDILSMEGNSGPYIQYTFARTQSVLRKAGETNYELRTMNYELTEEEVLLLRLLYKFDETVVAAAEKYSPNILTNYLFSLAQQFNLFYQKVPILKPSSHPELDSGSPEMPKQVRHDELRNFRLALTEAVGKTLQHGLSLLGIQAPQQM